MKNLHSSARVWAFFVVSFLAVAGAKAQTPAQTDARIVREWNALFLEMDRYAPGFRPCPAASAAGYLGLSLYETIVPAMPDFQSLGLAGLAVPPFSGQPTDWRSAANESYYYMMSRYFEYVAVSQPTRFAKIAALRQTWRSQLTLAATPAAITSGEARGQAVAAAVWAYLESDLVAKNAWLTPQPTSYVPPVGTGLWAPTAPDFSRAVFPFFGNSRTFALPESEKVSPPPPVYSESPTSKFYQDALQVFNQVNEIRSGSPLGRSYEWVAEFWSDDLLNVTFSPPLRLLAVAGQIGAQENLTLAEAAELYAKLGLAMHDGATACWKSKYVYNVERPASYINRVIPGGATWKSALDHPITGVAGITPAFPAYPSGHSTFGGISDGVMTAFFGSNYAFIDSSHLGRTEFESAPRAFSSFKQAGEENAASRIPLGVHYEFDCSEGLRLGRLCAQRVLEMRWRKPDCDLVVFTPSAGQIEVRGLNSPVVLIQVFDQNWQKKFDFTGQTGLSSIRKATGLAAGKYFVKVNLLNSNWQPICEKTAFIDVPNGQPVAVLTFPQPLDLTATATSAAGVLVNFSTPSATSTCSSGATTVVQTSGAASGSIFPVGQTQICFRASDGCGNSTEKCFKITVSPQVATGCAGVLATAGAGQITVSGLTSPNCIVQIFSSNWSIAGSFFGSAAGGERVFSGLLSGQYFVKVDLLNTSWQPICQKEIAVSVGSTPPPPPPTGPDLEIKITANKATSALWTSINYRIEAKNAGNQAVLAATIKVGGCTGAGVLADFDQSLGLVWANLPSAPTAGAFNFINRLWSIPTLAAGQTATLDLTLFLTSTGEKKVVAFAASVGSADGDSQPSANPPANCLATQDDECFAILNAVAPLLAGNDRESISDFGFRISDFEAFPNPTDGPFSLNLTPFLGKKMTLEITDALGRNVFSKHIEKVETAIFDLDLATENAGVFTLKAQAENERAWVKKVVLARL